MFIDIGVNRVGNDPKAVYARVAREIFDDGVVHWGRIVAFFALTIYFQRRFDIQFEKEVTDFVEEFLSDWMDNNAYSSACGFHCMFYAVQRCVGFDVGSIANIYSNDAVFNDAIAEEFVRKM